MMASCQALAQFAASNSKHLSEMVAACSVVLKDCKAQCEKHIAEHEECRQCAEACDACLAECRKLAS